MKRRTDTARRFMAAGPETVFRALIDADALASWRTPDGMHGRMELFEPRPGGRIRMALVYDDPDSGHRGKTTADSDVFKGRFVEIVPNERVVEAINFESDDPSFAGTMTVTTSLSPVAGGTEVTFSCANVPPGISEADHLAGIASSLANLALYVERLSTRRH